MFQEFLMSSKSKGLPETFPSSTNRTGTILSPKSPNALVLSAVTAQPKNGEFSDRRKSPDVRWLFWPLKPSGASVDEFEPLYIMPAQASDITSVSKEKRVFPPSREFSKKARVKSLAE